MARTVGMTDEALLQVALNNLHSSVRLIVQSSKPSTLSEALKHAACQASPASHEQATVSPIWAEQLRADIVKDISSKFGHINSAQGEQHSRAPKQHKRRAPPQYYQRQQQPQNYPGNRTSKTYNTCIGCGKSISPHRQRCQNCPASDIPCTFCDIPGHFEHVCRRKQGFCPPLIYGEGGTMKFETGWYPSHFWRLHWRVVPK